MQRAKSLGPGQAILEQISEQISQPLSHIKAYLSVLQLKLEIHPQERR